MIFQNEYHKRLFETEKTRLESSGSVLQKKFIAALYLLTAHHFLWSRLKIKIAPNRISVDGVSLSGISQMAMLFGKQSKNYIREKSRLPSPNFLKNRQFQIMLSH